MYNKNILDLNGLKFELKSVYAVDLAKQASNIQEITLIIQEIKQKQCLAEVTRLQCRILTIAATSFSTEGSSSSHKCVNNEMRHCKSEHWLSNLVFISMNKYLLKRIKVEQSADKLTRKWSIKLAKRKEKLNWFTNKIKKKLIHWRFYFFLSEPVAVTIITRVMERIKSSGEMYQNRNSVS